MSIGIELIWEVVQVNLLFTVSASTLIVMVIVTENGDSGGWDCSIVIAILMAERMPDNTAIAGRVYTNFHLTMELMNVMKTATDQTDIDLQQKLCASDIKH